MADFSLPYLLPEESCRRWTAEAGGNNLPRLINMLRAQQIIPNAGPRYAELRAAIDSPCTEWVPPVSVLALTPAEVTQLAVDAGTRHAARRDISSIQHELRRHLAVEMLQSMALEVDDYVRQMQPAFDTAAAQLEKVAQLGITPLDNPETVMERGPAAVEAYLNMTRNGSGAVRTLQRIASVRIWLSLTLGVWPANRSERGPAIDYAACFTKPYQPGITIDDDPRDAWRSWLAMCPHLHLNTLDEIPDRVRKAAGNASFSDMADNPYEPHPREYDDGDD